MPVPCCRRQLQQSAMSFWVNRPVMISETSHFSAAPDHATRGERTPIELFVRGINDLDPCIHRLILAA